MQPESNNDDLRDCLTNQPRHKPPKPKREVTDLTFSFNQWRKTKQSSQRWYSRPIPPLHQWPKWVFIALIASILVVAVAKIQTAPVSLWSTHGPISTENLSNFPPPHPVREIATDGQAVVVMTNASPGLMRIAMDGEEKHYRFQVQPCRSCSPTASIDLGTKLCERGPQEVMYVEPGEYQVYVSFSGLIKDLKSQWKLTQNWEYEQCLFGKAQWLY